MKGPPSSIAGLYAIADDRWTPRAVLPAYVASLAEGGCSVVQLRMKGAAPFEVEEVAARIMPLLEGSSCTFIVNDHADVAVRVGACGVHVGEHDAPVAELRARYGEKLVIGYSSHSLSEARKAAASGADYVAFGAIFPTRTKGPGHPVQGVEKLREVVAALPVPVVAIGGIGRETIDRVVATGVDAVAMISALSQAADAAQEARWFVQRIKDGV